MHFAKTFDDYKIYSAKMLRSFKMLLQLLFLESSQIMVNDTF